MDDIGEIYGADEDSDAAPSAKDRRSQMDAKTRGQIIELVIEDVKVSLPHPDHVAYLDRRLAAVEGTIAQLRGDITRLRQVIREQTDGMRGMRRDLDTKVDRG